MVMFHVKLSTALWSLRPFSPSFTAKSWRFSWNCMAGEKTNDKEINTRPESNSNFMTLLSIQFSRTTHTQRSLWGLTVWKSDQNDVDLGKQVTAAFSARFQRNAFKESPANGKPCRSWRFHFSRAKMHSEQINIGGEASSCSVCVCVCVV